MPSLPESVWLVTMFLAVPQIQHLSEDGSTVCKGGRVRGRQRVSLIDTENRACFYLHSSAPSFAWARLESLQTQDLAFLTVWDTVSACLLKKCH